MVNGWDYSGYQNENPANFVPVRQYNQLALKLNAQKSTGLVELALREGKITPALVRCATMQLAPKRRAAMGSTDAWPPCPVAIPRW